MSIGKICSRVVVTILPGDSVRLAARRMMAHGVGTLVVTASLGGEAVGIVTDRDIALRCVGENHDPDQTPVSDVMTRPLQTIDEETPIEEALGKMADASVRRLLVTDVTRRAVGVLSLDDVLDLLIEEAGLIGKLLEKQGRLILT